MTNDGHAAQEASPALGAGKAESSRRDAHVLVVDDDTRIRSLLQRYLQANGFRVTTASDAAEARAQLTGLVFDLVVLDIMMPGEDGLSLTKALRRTSDVPILLLTARGEAEDRIAGLEVGADDYLPKPFEPRELLLRAETIVRRTRKPAPAQRIVFGDCAFDRLRGELTRGSDAVRLTDAEATLLNIFCENIGRTISRENLCALTGVALERSVDVQVNRLRRKIEPEPKAPAYLQTVRGAGYVFYTE